MKTESNNKKKLPSDGVVFRRVTKPLNFLGLITLLVLDLFFNCLG